MKRIRSNYHALQVLGQAGQKFRKAIINSCDKELLNAISEIILHVLNGTLTLSNFGKRKHKTALRKLVDKRVTTSAKRRYIVQRGGFFSYHCSSQCYPPLLVCFSEYNHVAKNVSRTARGIGPPRKQCSQIHSHKWLKVKSKVHEVKIRNDMLIKSIGQCCQLHRPQFLR
jgi:hypothetical protein